MDTEDERREKLIDKTYEIFMLSPEEFRLLAVLVEGIGNPRFTKLISNIQSLRGE